MFSFVTFVVLCGELQAWLGSPSLSLLAETEGFQERLETLVCRGRVRGPVIHDARVAALCLAHGVEVLFSRDRDFALFPELPVRDPFSDLTGKNA